MNPVTAINAALAAIDLVGKLLPVIQELHASGNVSVDQQTQVIARLDALRTQTSALFSGPEWQVAFQAEPSALKTNE